MNGKWGVACVFIDIIKIQWTAGISYVGQTNNQESK